MKSTAKPDSTVRSLRGEVVGALRGMLSVKARRRIAMGRLYFRRATSAGRSLPNLLIIGAQRAGTSSLYKYLEDHPEVASSLRKEVEYFTAHYAEGEQWYRAHFPGLEETRTKGYRVLFEASPNYLLDPRCAHRAAALLPDAKIVVLLRDPVKRAFSHHQHNRRLGLENLSFAEAVAREPERLAEAEKVLLNDPEAPLPTPLRRYSYLKRGRYAEQLTPWIERYGPERVHVIISEELFAEPAPTYSRLEAFLGLTAWNRVEFENQSYVGRATPVRDVAPDPDLVDRLRTLFAESNRELEKLTSRKIIWGDRSAPVTE